MYIKWTFFLLCFCGVLISKPLEVNVLAKHALLINNENGRILFEKNADEKCFPASITKIATALFVLDQFAPYLEQPCQATSDALQKITLQRKTSQEFKSFSPYVLEPGCSLIGLQNNEKIILKDLLFAMIIGSANDAANVIAANAFNSIPQFIDQMNLFLKKIGCQTTHFCNPHGIHYPDHFTTAKDLAMIFQKGIQNPLFLKMIQTCDFSFPKTNLRKEKIVHQTNGLIKRNNRNFCPYVMGGKTGFTSQAGYCLIALGEHEKRFLTAVVLNSPSSETRYQDIQKLFKAAFEEKKESQKVVSAYRKFSLKISGGKNPLIASLAKDLFLETYPSEEGILKAKIHWGKPKLPIKLGQEVGSVVIRTEKGFMLTKAPIFSKNNVNPTFFHWLKTIFLPKNP